MTLFVLYMSKMWFLVLISRFGLMLIRCLHPPIYGLCSQPFIRPLYFWLLLWSIFVLLERRRASELGIWVWFFLWWVVFSYWLTMEQFSLVEIFLVHLLHGFFLHLDNSTGDRLLITENRRFLLFNVQSPFISYGVLAWMFIPAIHNKLVISWKICWFFMRSKYTIPVHKWDWVYIYKICVVHWSRIWYPCTTYLMIIQWFGVGGLFSFLYGDILIFV